jgi:hypothetical protein
MFQSLENTWMGGEDYGGKGKKGDNGEDGSDTPTTGKASFARTESEENKAARKQQGRECEKTTPTPCVPLRKLAVWLADTYIPCGPRPFSCSIIPS